MFYRCGFKLLPVFALIVFSTSISSSQTKYKVSEIPKELLADAKAVVRSSQIEFEIKDPKTAVKRVTFAITILNSNGLKNSVLTEFYNKFLAIRKITWDLYDQNGIPIKNKSNIELKDYSAISGYSLYEDNRVKFVDPKFRTTPFTIEYSYEINYNGLLSYPEWMVYDDYNISVEEAVFKIITPKGFKFRFSEKNLPDPCSITAGKDKSTYSWVVKSQPAIKQEPFSTPLKDYTPIVYSAPNNFEISGYKGNCETWDNFSRWIDTLGRGRDILNPETTAKIRGLVAGLRSDYEKVDAIYNYLQAKVRYVSVQVGIGGWQTIDAETVDRLSYGDCKALANYMKSLLGIAGIKSYYALVSAGESSPDIREDFPSTQFNHVMVCVPIKKDTIWLECTSQHIPAGYIGKFADDRKALLTGEGGGVLARTKVYSISNNAQLRHALINLGPDGNAESLIKTSYNGSFYDDIYIVLMMDKEDRKKFLQSRISIPSFELLDFKHVEKRQMFPVIDEEIRLSLPNYGTLIGNKMVFNPNLMTRFGKLPYRTKERKSQIRIRRAYCESDSIVFNLPNLYKVDQVPGKRSILSRFGEYSTEIFFNSKEVRYIRSFRLFKGDYPATDYEDFIGFCEQVSDSDERKIVLSNIFNH